MKSVHSLHSAKTLGQLLFCYWGRAVSGELQLQQYKIVVLVEREDATLGVFGPIL